MDTTVVSFYFDLGKIENNPSRRQIDDYYSTAEKLLCRKVNLFFMGPRNVLDFVKEIRAKHKLLHKTYLHEFELEESQYYKYLPILQKVHQGKGLNSFEKCTRMTPHYFVCIYTKFQALQLAIEKNPFQTKNFCWIDFGVFHICWDIGDIDFMENLNHFDEERVKVVLLKSIDRNYIRDRTQFYSKDNYTITGQIFGGYGPKVLQFKQKFDQELEHSVNIGLPSNEENIMAVVCGENEKDFDVGISFYSTCLWNFTCIKKEYSNLLFYISQLRANGYNHFAYQLIQKGLEGFYRGNFHFTPDHMYQLYSEYVIVSFYAAGRDKYRKIVNEFKTYCFENGLTIDPTTANNLVY